MNPEEIKGVVETIKTLNINFNDATTQKIADAILPVFQWYLFVQLLENLTWFVGILILVVLTYKALIRTIEADKEKKFKELENEAEETRLENKAN
jgi:hypothetical protein